MGQLWEVSLSLLLRQRCLMGRNLIWSRVLSVSPPPLQDCKTRRTDVSSRYILSVRHRLINFWDIADETSEGIVHLLLGNNTAHVLATAMANQLALTMRLNEESVSQLSSLPEPADIQSYDGLDPIESEMRRRIYWVSPMLMVRHAR
jgi:hypothetical protein